LIYSRKKMFRPIIVIIAAGLILAGGIIFALTYADIQPLQIEVVEIEEEILPEETGPSTAELVIKILTAAYPGRIEKAEFRNDDWAVLMDGIWYYYAGGRMLPEALMERVDEFTGSVGMYNYQSELPPWTEPTPEQSERYRSMGISRNSNNTNNNSETPRPQRERSNHFREALWQSSNRSESSLRVKSVSFLGKTVVVHSGIAGVLSLVEKRIMALAEADSQVRTWVTGIGEVTGWNWRNVANSESRSNHSYGIAIDILPKSLGGKQTYWQWAAQSGRDWWSVPYTDRYHPPDAVIKAFEAYGFAWGGKWTYYDTMHFEYRPEVFIFSGMELETVQ
jgi:hypothetical protein